MKILNPGDPCPFCGQPLRMKDPDTLRLLAVIADIAGLPEPGKEGRTDEREVSCTGGSSSK